MSKPEFNILLGGGLYMDSNGDVHRGTLPAKATYPMPGGGLLPVTREAFEQALTGTTKALQGIVKVLPDPKDPDSIKRLTDLGVSNNFINLLSNLGGVAAKFATVIPIVGAAVVVLQELINFFSPSGPSPVEKMILAQFADMHTHINALEMQLKLSIIDQKRGDISQTLTHLNAYMEEVTKFQPSLSELQRARAQILLDQAMAANAVEILLQYNTWLLSYNPDTFKQVWPWAGSLLHLAPAGTPTPAPQPAPTLPPYQNRFEHGMMVPAVIHAVQSYLMLIKALAPEYRSTGVYAGELRKFTGFLENLTSAMRAETLARTIYPVAPTPIFMDRFEVDLEPWEVIDLGGLPPFIASTCTRFPVGALDLCVHTDLFFQQQRQAAIAAGSVDPWYGPAILGNMNSRWIPPAKLEKFKATLPGPGAGGTHTETCYRITNPGECAAAANAELGVDYSKLLVSSGYLNLVQMTTLIRHLATEPDRSETVKGDVILLRNPEATKDVTVKSENIVFTGVIESSARREPSRCRAIVPISTQPLREDRMLPYRIVLRTLRSILSPNQWLDPKYEDYYSTRYEMDPAVDHAGFLRLVTETKDPWVLDEKELWPAILPPEHPSTSPRELVQHSDEVTLTAHTFDWYVPVQSSLLGDDHLTDTLAALRSAGWNGPKPAPIPGKMFLAYQPPSSTLTLADELAIVDSYIWQGGTQDWEGQRREMAETSVQIKYKLQWQADRLRISLENRPQDRNYVVFLVVEETFPPSGQILHTALPVPMNGQLTYVPQKFFDEEKAAIDKANRIVLDVATRYAESGPVGPEDPFIGNIRPGELHSVAGLQRLAGLAKQHQSALLRQAVQRYDEANELMKSDGPLISRYSRNSKKNQN